MTDFDGPWKEVLELYFERFLAFFFPQAHADIDWGRGFAFSRQGAPASRA